MRWLGYKQKRVSSLRLPGSLAARKKLPHVIELAADIRELGDEPINAPVFDKAGDIIAGRDRMAALLINKAKRCWIRIAEATAAERRALEASENLFRRIDNRNELIAARVAALAENIAASRHGTNVTGEAPSYRDVADARAKVARQVGITPAGVRKAESRAKDSDIPSGDLPARPPAVSPSTAEAARGGEAVVFPSAPNPPCPIDDFGIEMSPAFRVQMSEMQGIIETINRYLVNAQAELAKLKTMNFSGVLWQRLKAELHAAAYNARAAKPAMACVYCRDPDGAALLRDNCNGCGGRGYLVEEQRAMIPKELRDKERAPALGSRRKATLRIEDKSGKTTEITREDPESLPLPLGPTDDTKGDEDDRPF
jgi:hypothetical protein